MGLDGGERDHELGGDLGVGHPATDQLQHLELALGQLVEALRADELRRRAGDVVLDELSERELEVLRLVGRGMSNAEIAAELVISLATVKTHVRHVLQKLRLRDRVQAVVVAYESGLIPKTPARG